MRQYEAFEYFLGLATESPSRAPQSQTQGGPGQEAGGVGQAGAATPIEPAIRRAMGAGPLSGRVVGTGPQIRSAQFGAAASGAAAVAGPSRCAAAGGIRDGLRAIIDVGCSSHKSADLRVARMVAMAQMLLNGERVKA